MFSDLMRNTLEYSSRNFITLAEELRMLDLYLNIEKLRFGDDLEADIRCDISEEQQQDLKVPSMLIQPYVENAIKHGLQHKSGTKKLDINFYVSDNVLTCEITDNGVGRKKSEEIKQRRAKSYASFSSEANEKRIDLIRESTNMRISLDIIDLEENGRASGTKVILKFK
jgi:LytS/YehU family sensor histidine kinase